MPQRPLRPCVHKGCRELHRNANSYCNEHQDDAKAWARPSKSAAIRMTGPKLQARRRRLWAESPVCAVCGCLTELDPRAKIRFELDHKVRLADGGEDTEANCQILCVWLDELGAKQGCHAEKTAREG